MRRFVSAVMVLAMVAGACGDDDGAGPASTDGTAPPPTVATTIAATTPTEAETTTSEAPVTTEGVVSPHPFWGAGWDDIWPAEGATATYRAETWGGDVMEITATMAYDVEWKGGTWAAFILGTPEDGKDGLIVYLDRSDPWVPTFKGVEGYSSTLPSGQVQTEWFEDPMPIDISGDVGHRTRFEAPLFLSFTGDDGDAHDIYYELETVSLDDTVEVPVGTLDGCFHLGMKVGGPYIGSDDAFFTADVWAHPDHFVVLVTEMPVFSRIELAEDWSWVGRGTP